jgi:hypothetical protein
MARKPLTPEQRELISRRTREAMARADVREKLKANSSPERRELISRRTREAMAEPEIRDRVREGTRRGVAAAEAIVSDEVAALRCAWRAAGAKARMRFLAGLVESSNGDAR